MIEQLKVYDGPVLALEIIEGFDENDFELIQKWADLKRENGFLRINLLLKLDELKLSESNIKALLKQMAKLMKNFKQIGNIAIVAHSDIVKGLVPIDNFFFQIFSKDSEERYFDIADIEDAFAFIEADIKEK